MTSTSGNDGSSSITVTFDITRNLDVAAVDVQNRISQAEGRLPNEVKQVGISVIKVSSNFVLAAAAYAEKGEYDTLFISNYVDRFVVDEIKRVPGRRQRVRLRHRPLRDAAVGRSRQARRPRHHRGRSGRGAARTERPGGGRRRSAIRPAPKGQTYQISVRAERAAERSVRSSRTSSSSGRPTARWCACATSAAPSSARKATPPRRGSTRATRSASACCSCRPPTPCRSIGT